MSADRRTSSLAIVSLVAGLLGWTFAPGIGAIVAVITGHMARAEIRRQPAEIEGDGFAVAGLVLGWVMLLMALFAALAVVLFLGGFAALLVALGPSA